MSNYSTDVSIRRLWTIFAASMIIMFGALLFFGYQIYLSKPPIPDSVRSASGQVLYTKADIERGQNVWQSMGGMEQGSIWGHGSYVAPDWTADWLHREATTSLDLMAKAEGASSYAQLPKPDQARLRAMFEAQMRTNTYDPATGTITVDKIRAQAIAAVGAYFDELLLADTPKALKLRVQYAFPVSTRLAPEDAK